MPADGEFAFIMADMDRPVSHHLAMINERLAEMEKESAATNDELRKREIETDMRELRLAVAHYELALKLEDAVLRRPRR